MDSSKEPPRPQATDQMGDEEGYNGNVLMETEDSSKDERFIC